MRGHCDVSVVNKPIPDHKLPEAALDALPPSLNPSDESLLLTSSWPGHGGLLYALSPDTGTVRAVTVETAVEGATTPVGIEYDPSSFIRLGNATYFRGSTGATGTELYRLEDGSAFAKSIEIAPGEISSTPGANQVGGLFAWGDQLYFTAATDESGSLSLFSLRDGSDNPILIKDISGTGGGDGSGDGSYGSDTIYSGSVEFMPWGGSLYFSVTGEGLYRMTGASNSAQLVFENPDVTISTAFDGKLYFNAIDPEAQDHRLYMLESPNDDPVRLDFSGAANIFNAIFNDELYFTANGGTLYKLSGDALEPSVVTLDIGTDFVVNGETFTEFNGELYFEILKEGAQDWKLYKLAPDGTSSQVGDMRGGGFVEVNGDLFFTGGTNETGFELYKIDADNPTPVLVADIVPGPQSSFITDLTAIDGDLYFGACPSGTIGPDSGYELYKLDLDTMTTATVDIPDHNDLYPFHFI